MHAKKNTLQKIKKNPNVVFIYADDLVGLTDWLTTFADMVGEELFNNVGEDSKSILALLKGEKLNNPVWESIIHHTASGKFAIRKNEWVYIDHHTGAESREPDWFKEERNVQAHSFPGELYNLKSDPQQTTNLYEQFPEKVDEMKKLLIEQKKGGRSVAIRN
ncbi:hypothetical protein OU798_03550 [Prolixibacteraceae bacterium Z1-6]|uniref:Arylsulfatase n=1 Tax=Draconibacterium aestuarii TaxID=2998507 RepID=A0A9X3J3I5_9BACT|nr:hypothetical protein [Prolixibacteraceae bacterium Z1-6]